MNSIVVLIGVVITLVTGIPVMLQLLRQHPRALFILFFAEMWERFSYYGMRGLLVFYLTQQFLFDDKFAAGTFGSYATLVYLLPLIGGVLADRFLGARKAVAFGALLLVAGHLTMAIEGQPARQVLTYAGAHYDFQVTGRGDERLVKLQVAGHDYEVNQTAEGVMQIKDLPTTAPLPATLAKGSFAMSVEGRDQGFVNILFLALALIIMGVGFLKSNISALVGQLYTQGDPQRDPGFTLFYYGVNLGAFWAAIICGYLGQHLGWNYGFGLAGVGMLAGYATFMLGKPLLLGKGEPPNPVTLAKPIVGPVNGEWAIYLLAILGVGGIWLLVQHGPIVGYMLGGGWVVTIGYLAYFMVTQCSKVQRERLYLAILLLAGPVVFFTLFEQAATSLNLFADRNTDLALTKSPIIFWLFGHEVFMGAGAMLAAAHPGAGVWWIDTGFNAAQVQSLNAGFILILAPAFAALWSGLARRGRDLDPVTKFGLALLQVGLGFLVIVWSQGFADATFKVPLLVLVFTYLLHTTGELCLSPVGLSEFTKLAPPALISTLLSVWFLAVSAAQFIAGMIAKLASADTAGGQVLDPKAAFHTSLHVFQLIGFWGLGIGAAFLIVAPFVRHWGHGVNDAANHTATV